MMPDVNRNFRSQVVSFGIIQVIQRFRGLIVFAVVTRLIGPYGYGLITPLAAVAGFAQVFILLGTTTSLTVILPGKSQKDRSRHFWGIAQLVSIVSLAVLTILVLLFGFISRSFLPSETPFDYFVLGMAIIPLSSLYAVLYSQIIVNKEGQAFTGLTGVLSVVDIAVLAAGGYWFGVRGILIAYLISQALLCIWMSIIILPKDKFVWLTKISFSELKEYYSYGWTVFLSGLAAWTIDSCDRLILSRYVDPSELGSYSAVYGLCSQLNQLGIPFFSSLMPFIAGALAKGDKSSVKDYLDKTLRMLLFVFIPAVLIFILTGKDVVSLLATKEFMGGVIIIPFVALGVAFWQVMGVFSHNIHAHQKGNFIIFSTSVGALVNLVINFIYIPKYGILAAAISTLAAYSVIFILHYVYSCKLLSFSLKKGFLGKIFLVSCLAFIPTFFIRPMLGDWNILLRLVFLAGLSGALFLAGSYVVSLFDQVERKNLLNTVSAIFGLRKADLNKKDLEKN